MCSLASARKDEWMNDYYTQNKQYVEYRTMFCCADLLDSLQIKIDDLAHILNVL